MEAARRRALCTVWWLALGGGVHIEEESERRSRSIDWGEPNWVAAICFYFRTTVVAWVVVCRCGGVMG